MKLHWKRLLFYCLLPVLLVLALVGFPMPLAPPKATRPAQEQSVRVDDEARKR